VPHREAEAAADLHVLGGGRSDARAPTSRQNGPGRRLATTDTFAVVACTANVSVVACTACAVRTGGTAYELM